MISPRALSIVFILTINSLSAKNYWNHTEKQGVTGACHAFATLGLVEAEYYLATGKMINLSERDLFIHQYLGSHASAEAMLTNQLYLATKKSLPAHYNEGSTIDYDFKILKRNGVALESELKFQPTFSAGVALTLKKLKEIRNQTSLEANSLRQASNLNPSTTQQLIQKQLNILRRQKVIQFFTIKPGLNSRINIRNFLSPYTLKKIPLSSPSKTLSLLKTELTIHPVAVDVRNYKTLVPNSEYTALDHRYHCVIISAYDPKTNTFTARNSNAKGKDSKANEIISANGLAKLAYNLYYLKK